MSDLDKPSFDSMFQPAEALSQRGYSTEPVDMDRSDDFSAPGKFQNDRISLFQVIFLFYYC